MTKKKEPIEVLEILEPQPQSEPQPIEITVTVNEDQLRELINQNLLMKDEIAKLVAVFQNFSALLSGKNISSLLFTLPRLINDPNVAAQIEDIAPIINKYTQNPVNNG